jgi:hypothetical protein
MSANGNAAAGASAIERERYVTERAEQIASAFHYAYERRAPEFGYTTRRSSAVPWQYVSEQNRGLMIATVRDLIDKGVLK